MHELMRVLGGDHGHGHSHGADGSCSAHGPGRQVKPEMTQEMRAELLRHLEAQMELMNTAHGRVISHGHTIHDPASPDPRPYNPLVFGYGHDPAPLPAGWGSLAASLPQPVMPFTDEMRMGREAVQCNNFWSMKIPFVGRLRIVKDKSGVMQAFGIVIYWLYGNWSTWNGILLPYYYDGVLSLWLLLMYALVSVLCITSFIRASTLNPGSLHVNQSPKADWAQCKVCMVLRPPLSHHCRRCGQCVRRMDHHCPWINNCVGEENQFAFILLLLYAFLLSCLTLGLTSLYFFLDTCNTCNKEAFVIQHQNEVICIDFLIAFIMLVSSLGLLFMQHISVINETPNVEWMKLQQEMLLTGVVPKQMMKEGQPICRLYAELCGTSSVLIWPFPCRQRYSPSDNNLLA